MLKRQALATALILVFSLGKAFSQDTADTAGKLPSSVQGSSASVPTAIPADGYRPAEGLENWRYEHDLSGYKPGTYNIIVRVRDTAGNIALGGPFNIVIDPASDLPLTRIAHPIPSMRIGADLNIVGTSKDDDAVQYVELSIDDGPWLRAEGGEYWSHYLSTASMADGLHTISARSVDENGVLGPADAVRFYLDRTKPVATVASPPFGTLVSGRLVLSGELYDANGLNSLVYSLDEGASWTKLKYKLNKAKTGASFSLAVDTRKMDDGPAVLWFKSVDGLGSEGVSIFLYFVDNTRPELSILSPLPTETVNGRFRITGRAYDTVGLRSLGWEYGKESGQVELVPGNPYFSVEFSAPAQGSKVSLRFSAEDISGNRSTLDQGYALDVKADIPRLRLARPLANERIEGALRVHGAARDDDGIAAIEWRLDNGSTASIESDGVFSFTIDSLPAGKRMLSLRAVDTNGLAGPWLDVPLLSVAEPPRLEFTTLSDATGERPFAPGLSFSTLEGRAALGVRVTAPNTLETISFAVNDGPFMPLRAAKSAAPIALTLPLPASLPFGVLTLRLKAVDAAGKESVLETPLYALNYAKVRLGPVLDFAGAVPGDTNPIKLSAERPFIGAFVRPFEGEDIAVLRLEPPSRLLTASFDGSLLRIDPAGEGLSAPTTVVAETTRGHRFSAGPYIFATDTLPPRVSLLEPAFNSWQRGDFSLKAAASDGDALERVEYRLQGGAWLPLQRTGDTYGAAVSVGSLQGPLLIDLRAVDMAGNEASVASAVMVDSTAPSPELMLPLSGEPRGGRRLFAIRPGEPAFSTASIELGRAGAYETLSYAPVLSFAADAGEGALTLRVTDKAGNRTELDLAGALTEGRLQDATSAAAAPGVDKQAPVIELISPQGPQAGPFLLIARVRDDGGLASVSYAGSGEAGEFELYAGSDYVARLFSFPPKSKQLALTLLAVDRAGNKSQLKLSLAYDQAADSPVVRVLSPQAGSAVTGKAPFIVYAEDDDGLASLSLTLDGKNSVAEGPGPLYLVQPDAPTPGKKSAALSAKDSGGVESARVSIDFTQLGSAPVLTLSGIQAGKAPLVSFKPGLALAFDAEALLQGSVKAPNGLSLLEYAVNGSAWQKLSAAAKPDAGGAQSFSIPLAASLPYDRVEIALRARDALGAESNERISLYRLASPRALASLDEEGLYIADSRIRADGSLLLKPLEQFGLLWNGRPIASLRVEPAWPALELSFEGSAIRVKALEEGLSPPLTITLSTVDGDSYRARPLRFVVDAQEPSIRIDTPQGAPWLRDSLSLRGEAGDVNGLAELAWSLDGGLSWVPLATRRREGSTLESFSAELPLSAADGPGELLLRARDAAGRESLAALPYTKDSTAPALSLMSPLAGDVVNGIIRISGRAEDAGGLSSVEFAPDGKSWEALDFAPLNINPEAPKEGLPADRPASAAFSALVDLGLLGTKPDTLSFRARDKAGNIGLFTPLAGGSPAFSVDSEADKPRSQLQIPFEGEVQRSDFVVSGMAFDDDGIAELHWRLDGGDWQSLPGGNAFSVSFALADIRDNEHSFELYAVDINGVRGDTARRGFKVSREEPVGQLVSPELSQTNRGLLELKGTASDANGIKEVWLSFDNGSSYNKAKGAEDWSYILDTRILPDGVHSIYLRLVDGYDTEGFAAGLISVDNTAPSLALSGPVDGDEFVGALSFGGRASDAVGIQSLSYELGPLGAARPALTGQVAIAEVFSRTVDISGLPAGWYNLKVIAADRADNKSYESRNLLVRASQQAETAQFYFPVQGERLAGRFVLDGRVLSAAKPARAQLSVNGQLLATVDLNAQGWFSLPVDDSLVPLGELSFTVEAIGRDGAAIRSDARSLFFEKEGPWVEIDGLFTGDFLTGRPYLSGRAGWPVAPADKADKEAWAAYQRLLKERAVVAVEISRDNGRSFEAAKGSDEFRYRLETQEYPNGELRLIVRARFANGESAVRKRIVTVDSKIPQVSIARPDENGRFNGTLLIEGSAYDENGLESVEVAIRSGDKASYQVPGFIQGSYLDLHVFGATRFEAGLGLSFFEDNVKLQLNFGAGFDAQPSWDNPLGFATTSTPAAELSRFGGYVLGFKLLANLAYLPFGYYFGPDWDFFSMSFAMGASFTYFSQTGELGSLFSPPEGNYPVLAGIVLQWEFAKFSFGGSFMKSIGLYTEGGLVFIPSEASASLDEFIRPTVAFGIRLGLF